MKKKNSAQVKSNDVRAKAICFEMLNHYLNTIKTCATYKNQSKLVEDIDIIRISALITTGGKSATWPHNFANGKRQAIRIKFANEYLHILMLEKECLQLMLIYSCFKLYGVPLYYNNLYVGCRMHSIQVRRTSMQLFQLTQKKKKAP